MHLVRRPDVRYYHTKVSFMHVRAGLFGVVHSAVGEGCVGKVVPHRNDQHLPKRVEVHGGPPWTPLFPTMAPVWARCQVNIYIYIYIYVYIYICIFIWYIILNNLCECLCGGRWRVGTSYRWDEIGRSACATLPLRYDMFMGEQAWESKLPP